MGGEGGDGVRGRALLRGRAVVRGAAVLDGGRSERGVAVGGLGLDVGQLVPVGLEGVGHLLGGLEVVICGGVDVALVSRGRRQWSRRGMEVGRREEGVAVDMRMEKHYARE
jgi:hypothetical protein